MFLFRLARPAGSILVALVALATALIISHAAVAADSAASLRLKPGKHDFGKVSLMQASKPLTVTVTNKSGSAPVTFTSIVAAEPFAIQDDKCSGAPLVAGSSCKVEVVFRPTDKGMVSDKNALTFTDSSQTSPQQVELDGEGTVGSFL